MIKSKVTGFIDLGNGPFEVRGELNVKPDAEFIEQTRNFNEVVKKALRQTIDIVMVEGDIYRPTGPIVESTLAEKSEGSNG